MKNILFLVLLFCSFSITVAQNFAEEFSIALKEDDTAKCSKIIANWEKTGTTEAAFYIAAFNHYFNLSRKEIIALRSGSAPQNNHSGLVLNDSNGKEAGYIESQIFFDKTLSDIGLKYINKGIALYPNRLDMQIGKCYVLKITERYNEFLDHLTEILKQSVANNNAWLSKNDDKIENGQEYFLSTIFEYQKELYQTNDDSLLKFIIAIGEKTLFYYPTEIPIISITAISYQLSNQKEMALELLKKAEKTNPSDAIVLNNIGNIYAELNKKKEAIDYYKRAIKFTSNEEMKKEIQERVNLLEK